jgi:hypothetical protein
MAGESPRSPSAPTGAVFLSYASQDTDAARRICDALRAEGIEVWFDQSELRGGDAWDRQIRKQIHDCALFIPLISQHSQERLEGYFRLEWKLAVDRSHRMAAERSFIVPVVVDSTRERDALVPGFVSGRAMDASAGGASVSGICRPCRYPARCTDTSRYCPRLEFGAGLLTTHSCAESPHCFDGVRTRSTGNCHLDLRLRPGTHQMAGLRRT